MRIEMDEPCLIFQEIEIKITPHVKQFMCFQIGITLWNEIKTAARFDWLFMVMPSLFTKTWGRTLMVLGVIHYQNFLNFLLQNLMYAAPEIAFISGAVVFFYQLYLQRKAGIPWGDTLKYAGIFFLKTAVKFFIVYMGWVMALGWVTALGWFAGPFLIPALLVLALCIAGLIFTKTIRWVLQKYIKSKAIEIIMDVVVLVLTFMGVAAAAYFLSPILAGLLLVGGITALSLWFATFITEVLPDSAKNVEKARKTLSRAYVEGVVWAFAERMAIQEIVSGFFGGFLDVMCVCFSVCAAIFIGGHLDAHYIHYNTSTRRQLTNQEKEGLKKYVRDIQQFNISKNPLSVIKSIDAMHSEYEISLTHIVNKYIKRQLLRAILTELENCGDIDQFKTQVKSILSFLAQPRVGWVPIGICRRNTVTHTLVNRIFDARARVLLAQEKGNEYDQARAQKEWENTKEKTMATILKTQKKIIQEIKGRYGFHLVEDGSFSPGLFRSSSSSDVSKSSLSSPNDELSPCPAFA